MKNMFVLFLTVLAVTSCRQGAQNNDKTMQALIADNYGVDKINDINTLGFTFNVMKDTFSTSRTWLWDKKNNTVKYTTPTDSGLYKRDTIQSEAMKKIDGMFVNDQYWLLFPMHLADDSNATRTVVKNVEMPLTKAQGSKITIQYKDDNGYTPNDAYDLYVDDKNMVKEWAYRKGGIETPTLATTWQDDMTEKGVRFTTRFNNDSTKFSIFFTDIKVD